MSLNIDQILFSNKSLAADILSESNTSGQGASEAFRGDEIPFDAYYHYFYKLFVFEGGLKGFSVDSPLVNKLLNGMISYYESRQDWSKIDDLMEVVLDCG